MRKKGYRGSRAKKDPQNIEQTMQPASTQPGANEPDLSTPSQPIDLSTVSFEAKISLALRGGNWQALQNNTIPAIPLALQTLAEDTTPANSDVTASEVEMPKVQTAKQKKKQRRFDQTIAKDTGQVFELIEPETLRPVSEPVTWEGEPELLCSYNWQGSNDGTNTIFVPGQPQKWMQPPLPFTLEPDSGINYLDCNYGRQPKDPFAPMFRALEIMRPGYSFKDVDVLSDRNSLRVLLEFVQGKANGPFRLDLYLNFKTLIIVRKLSKWWQTSDGGSYGFNFERHFTRPAEGMEDATGHYRAIRYRMGPLSVVCRFEADSYDDGAVPDEAAKNEPTNPKDILETKPHFDYRAPISVVQKGQVIPAAQLVELKTRKYDPNKGSSVPCSDQLWFGRTSLLYIGPYEPETGAINCVRRDDAMDKVKKWEDSNQENLRKLVALLLELRGIVDAERTPNRALVLVRENKNGPLSLRSMEGMHRAVGREFFLKFWMNPNARR